MKSRTNVYIVTESAKGALLVCNGQKAEWILPRQLREDMTVGGVAQEKLENGRSVKEIILKRIADKMPVVCRIPRDEHHDAVISDGCIKIWTGQKKDDKFKPFTSVRAWDWLSLEIATLVRKDRDCVVFVLPKWKFDQCPYLQGYQSIEEENRYYADHIDEYFLPLKTTTEAATESVH